jgi:hypothetical protein
LQSGPRNAQHIIELKQEFFHLNLALLQIFRLSLLADAQ